MHQLNGMDSKRLVISPQLAVHGAIFRECHPGAFLEVVDGYSSGSSSKRSYGQQWRLPRVRLSCPMNSPVTLMTKRTRRQTPSGSGRLKLGKGMKTKP